jgi:hypothetical protein
LWSLERWDLIYPSSKGVEQRQYFFYSLQIGQAMVETFPDEEYLAMVVGFPRQIMTSDGVIQPAQEDLVIEI